MRASLGLAKLLRKAPFPDLLPLLVILEKTSGASMSFCYFSSYRVQQGLSFFSASSPWATSLTVLLVS